MATHRKGRCACGTVTFEFDFDPTFVAICHCLDCKKASGGEAATWFGVPTTTFRVTAGADQTKGFLYVADSGKRLTRNFCTECGARLFTSDLEGFPELTFIQIGSLDDPSGIRPVLEMFVKRRLDWQKPLDLPQFSDMPH
ncbi:GFA family protein [Sphingomonas azotifigens]|uniref:GFA family protein n=1 Tax=Sphingomonas azotifigens TaxID=330920 RepID=UPI000A0559B5|nr:GFA family protein [Sphingomonas azotifigens]